MSVENATVHAAQCQFVGGDSFNTQVPWPAVYVPPGSTVDLVDCTLQGGNTFPAGALGESALLSDPGSIVRHQRCQFLSGTGPGGSPAPIAGSAAPWSQHRCSE
jgi:hypothetical protein